MEITLVLGNLPRKHLKLSCVQIKRTLHKSRYQISEENGSDLVLHSILYGFCGHCYGKDGNVNLIGVKSIRNVKTCQSVKESNSVSCIQCYECDGVKGGGGLCPGNAPWGERQVNHYHLPSRVRYISPDPISDELNESSFILGELSSFPSHIRCNE